MGSPFPGMDPYLESPTQWSDFHARFVPLIADTLNEHLPRNYVARLDEHVSLIPPISEVPGESVHVPDVTVVQRGWTLPAPRSAGGGGGAGPALLMPEPVNLQNVVFSDERTEVFVKIVRLPAQDLVTVLELLSPTNKYGGGRGEYTQKRREFLRLPVNVVELDLLRAGVRLEFAEPFPAGHYFTLVTRATRPGVTQAYPWTVRDAWPGIPVPLQSPDPDLVIDLQGAFTQAYARGRYDELIDYDKSPPPPAFNGGYAEWVAETARAGAKPS